MAPDHGLERWLAWRQVRDLTGLGRTTAWRMRREGDFPDPVPISPGRVAWRARDIAAWTATRGLDRSPPLRARSRPAALPEPRLAEPRQIPAPGHSLTQGPRAEGGPTEPEPSLTTEISPILKPPSRSRKRVAQGQLGFDF